MATVLVVNKDMSDDIVYNMAKALWDNHGDFVLYGLFMIAIVFFLPNGIVPAVTSWWRDRFGTGAGGAEPEAGPGAVEERA